MIRSPDQNSPGKQFELRVSASDLALDAKLSALTIPEARQRLPGFLHLFSQQKFLVSIDDRDIDGNSFTETRFRGFQMKVSNHTRNKFSLDSQVEKNAQLTESEELRIRMELQLGIQAASVLMTPPFFTKEERENGQVPLYYVVPDPLQGELGEAAFGELGDYLQTRPRGGVDELTLVEHAVRHRSIRHRQRVQSTDQMEPTY